MRAHLPPLLLLLLSAPPALAQATPGQPPSPPAAGSPDAVREHQLEELRRAVEAYEAEADEYRLEVQQLVEKGYRRRRDALEGAYEQHLAELEALERKERLDAIAQAEEFLQRYPDDPQLTPEVMFRLAELHYERATDDHLVAMREHAERLRTPAVRAGTGREPQVDFSPSIALYRQLLARYPSFRDTDGVQYLLAYCLEKQGEREAGLAGYQRLLARFPQSRFVTEAWVRIGEHFFDADPAQVPDALARAAEAYERAARDTGHPLHDKALYKLGWTYYRLDRFPEAVARFLALVDLYEARARTRGERGAGGDLREEALQYVAISLADERFAGTPEARAALAGLEGRPYGPDLLRRTGEILFELTRHEEAIAVYRRVLEVAPLRADAPLLQDRIAQAYARDRRLAESFAEGERLATVYAPGTPWRTRNRRNADALATADRLAEQALSGAAVFHHQQAQAHRAGGRGEEARRSFEAAARAYAAFLQRFPRSKGAYELRYYLAECRFHAGQLAEAAQTYERVRDSTEGERYRTEAAYGAVLAWERQLEAEVRAGRAGERRPLKASERPAGAPVRPFPLAGPEQRLVAASDAFVAVSPRDARAAGVAYRAAERFFAHDDLPEARRRFEALLRAYPEAEVARFAPDLLAETYAVERDWAGLEETAGRLAGDARVAPPGSPLHQELLGFALAGRFKHADQLLAEGRPEEAARKYVALVDEAPDHAFADEALNNAAVAYESVRRFDAARRLYERLAREAPSSPLADGALFRAAVDAEQSYDFEGAVEGYSRLVRDFPASRHREAALANAARLLEALGRRDEAAAALLRAAELFPESAEAPGHQYRAALVREQQEDWRGAIQVLQGFLQRFAQRPEQAERAVEAHRRLGDAWQRLGNAAEARRAHDAAARAFAQRGLSPEAHPLAAEAASAARFALAEEELAAFERLTISGQGEALVRSLTAKKAALERATDAYGEVFAYKRLEWLLAAQFRRGFLLQRYAATLVDTPVPAEVRRLGETEVIAYQETVAAEAARYEELAAQAYVATLQVSQQNGLSSAWTRRTREALHQLRPAEHPLPREPALLLVTEEAVPAGLVRTLEAPRPDAPALAAPGAPARPEPHAADEEGAR